MARKATDTASHKYGLTGHLLHLALKRRGALASAVLKEVCILFCQDRLSTLVCSFCLWRYGHVDFVVTMHEARRYASKCLLG